MSKEYVSDPDTVQAFVEELMCSEEQAQAVERILFDNRIELIEIPDCFMVDAVFTSEAQAEDRMLDLLMEYAGYDDIKGKYDLDLTNWIDWDKVRRFADWYHTIVGEGDVWVILTDAWFEWVR